MATVALSGCLTPEPLDVGAEDPRGFASVDVTLHVLGEAPPNVTVLTLEFDRLAFREAATGDWLQVRPGGPVTVGLEGEREAAVGAVTLPHGAYDVLGGRLAGASVHEGEAVHEARVSPGQCRAPLSLVVDAHEEPSGLVLFFWVRDALVQEEGGWMVKPAFSGTSMKPGASDQETGNSRLGGPRCSAPGAQP